MPKKVGETHPYAVLYLVFLDSRLDNLVRFLREAHHTRLLEPSLTSVQLLNCRPRVDLLSSEISHRLEVGRMNGLEFEQVLRQNVQGMILVPVEKGRSGWSDKPGRENEKYSKRQVVEMLRILSSPDMYLILRYLCSARNFPKFPPWKYKYNLKMNHQHLRTIGIQLKYLL